MLLASSLAPVLEFVRHQFQCQGARTLQDTVHCMEPCLVCSLAAFPSLLSSLLYRLFPSEAEALLLGETTVSVSETSSVRVKSSIGCTSAALGVNSAVCSPVSSWITGACLDRLDSQFLRWCWRGKRDWLIEAWPW